jgi:protein gp37
MAENSAISWTDHTMNFWIGCTKVSPACTNCYAAVDTFARRERSHGRELWGPNADRHRTSAALWKKPYQWNKDQWQECRNCGWRGSNKMVFFEDAVDICPRCEVGNSLFVTRQRVFVSSLSDICEIHPQITDDMRREIAKIVMDCKNLDFLFLTKRPEYFNVIWLDLFGGALPDNLWVGTTVENQKYADERIPALMNIPAKVRFLSCEPLLGPVDLWSAWNKSSDNPITNGIGDEINWVIVGGESGSKARPMHPSWVRNLRNQCKITGIKFHFKQWGEYAPWNMEFGAIKDYQVAYAERNGTFSEMPSGTHMTMCKVGKKKSGRLLDGVEHKEFPK